MEAGLACQPPGVLAITYSRVEQAILGTQVPQAQQTLLAATCLETACGCFSHPHLWIVVSLPASDPRSWLHRIQMSLVPVPVQS